MVQSPQTQRPGTNPELPALI
ncbi:hypothetical protein, partial [Pseudomonas aeruginosa]